MPGEDDALLAVDPHDYGDRFRDHFLENDDNRKRAVRVAN
jgi:hypothetical protein